jgi:hypothetical protein
VQTVKQPDAGGLLLVCVAVCVGGGGGGSGTFKKFLFPYKFSRRLNFFSKGNKTLLLLPPMDLRFFLEEMGGGSHLMPKLKLKC